MVNSEIGALRESVSASLASHKRDRTLDSWLHNGGTVLVILANSCAMILSRDAAVSFQVATLTSISTAVVAIDRSLSFGARWQTHIRLANEYRTLLDRIDALGAFQEEDRSRRLEAVLIDLARVRREENLPGSGGASAT